MRQTFEMIVEVDLADILRVPFDSTNPYGKCRPEKGLIRCKDCDMWDTERSVGKEYLGTYRCQCENWSDFEGGMTRYTTADDFCSYAERREE